MSCVMLLGPDGFALFNCYVVALSDSFDGTLFRCEMLQVQYASMLLKFDQGITSSFSIPTTLRCFQFD